MKQSPSARHIIIEQFRTFKNSLYVLVPVRICCVVSAPIDCKGDHYHGAGIPSLLDAGQPAHPTLTLSTF